MGYRVIVGVGMTHFASRRLARGHVGLAEETATRAIRDIGMSCGHFQQPLLASARWRVACVVIRSRRDDNWCPRIAH